MAHITNIRHFLKGNELAPNMPAPARRLAEFLTNIISMVTLSDTGIGWKLPLRCRRRPKRKPCKGKISAYLKDRASEIEWECPVCGDNGIITNWQGTKWDLKDAKEEFAEYIEKKNNDEPTIH